MTISHLPCKQGKAIGFLKTLEGPLGTQRTSPQAEEHQIFLRVIREHFARNPGSTWEGKTWAESLTPSYSKCEATLVDYLVPHSTPGLALKEQAKQAGVPSQEQNS